MLRFSTRSKRLAIPSRTVRVPRAVRIATWNVNGLRARLDFILHWLESRQPDVVGMQELKVADDEFPMEAFNAVGYEGRYPRSEGLERRGDRRPAPLGRGNPRSAGTGRSRCPADPCPRGGLELRHRVLPEWQGHRSRGLPAQAGLGTTACANTSRASIRTRLSSSVATSNIVPDPIDCWRGGAADCTIFCTVEERDRFQALLDGGLVDPTPGFPAR